MNKINCTLLFLFVFSISVTAQEKKVYLENRIYPGYIITLQSDTIMGFVQNGDRERNQTKCIFYTNADDSKTKKTYKPSELKGYTIEDNHYRSVSYSGNINFGKAGRNFLLIMGNGRISTYSYFLDTQQLVWQKGDEDPISNASMFFSFKKNVLKLVGDNTEMAGKIERKEKGYGTTDIMAIVAEYNKWYEAKN